FRFDFSARATPARQTVDDGRNHKFTHFGTKRIGRIHGENAGIHRDWEIRNSHRAADGVRLGDKSLSNDTDRWNTEIFSDFRGPQPAGRATPSPARCDYNRVDLLVAEAVR